MKVLILNVLEDTLNYRRALQALGVDVVSSYTLPEDLSGFDGLLLPGGDDIDPSLFGQENNGSRDIDRTQDLTQLAGADAFVKAGKPVFGICKGIQVINVYFGGTLIQDLPDGVREHHTYHHGLGTGEFHDTFIEKNSFLYPLYGAVLRTNSYHHQAIDKVGDGLIVTQKSAGDGVIECVQHKNLPVIGTQWHPEKNIIDTVMPGVADGMPVFRYFVQMMAIRA